MSLYWSERHAECGVFKVNLQCRADGLYGWEASTPGYTGWQSKSAFTTEEEAKLDAESWLAIQLNEAVQALNAREKAEKNLKAIAPP